MTEPIKVGYVSRVHGIKGAVVIHPLTDDPDRFSVGRTLATDNRVHPALTILSCQPYKDDFLVTLEAIADRNTAESLRGTSLLIDSSERRDLEGDEFWPDQLIGLIVVDLDGVELGRVEDVIEGGAQDRLQILGEAGRFEIPFVEAIVTDVDVAGGRLVVDPPDGLVGDTK